MFKQRLHAFFALAILGMLVCIARLAYLQMYCCQEYREEIAQLRILSPRQLPTVRGSILDRRDRVVAIDRPDFFIQVNYQLTRVLDERLWQGNIERTMETEEVSRQEAEAIVREKLGDSPARLMEVMRRASEITGTPLEEIERRVRKINDDVWRLRRYIALRTKYHGQSDLSDAPITLWEILKTDLYEMYQNYPLAELQDDEHLLAAQTAMAGIEGTGILPKEKREYPYGSAACQIIGWVKPVQADETDIFSEDAYKRYLSGEVAGERGVEKVCEPILRGRRGEVVYNKDHQLISRKPTEFGRDVRLTLDIELQASIERLISDPNSNPNARRPTGAVVLDAATCDILAMVSHPTYDLNRVREDYNAIVNDPNSPMKSRAVYLHYPPGSTVKPLILAAGLEDGKVAPGTVIHCTREDQNPSGFPNCLLYRLGGCHDWKWENNARNAIRGSCNVYFSHLAHRLDGRKLQKWLYDFGFGHRLLTPPEFEGVETPEEFDEDFVQSDGLISMKPPKGNSPPFEDIPEIPLHEQKWFGIGQGNLRVTTLQVAAATSVFARRGVFKAPRLFLNDDDPYNENRTDLRLSRGTVDTVRDGMHAVVYEDGGTAHKPYEASVLSEGGRDLTLYGKTGSTQRPSMAWYSGFAEDSTGRAVVLAIVVEEGTSGAGDAAPLGMEIIRLCNEHGYVGQTPRQP